MPRNGKTRHKVRRKLEAAAILCQNINSHLAEASEPYEKDRPLYFQAMLQIGVIIAHCEEELRSIRRKI